MNEEEFLPGTSRLIEDFDQDALSTSHLQKHGDIVLSPQPSSSPNEYVQSSKNSAGWLDTDIYCHTNISVAH